MKKPCLIILLLLFPNLSLAAPKADLWPFWEKHDPTATLRIDHSGWNGLLQRYLSNTADGISRFSYGRVTAMDRASLDRYLAAMSRVEIGRYSRPQQMAYWINLYNALTVRTILDHYPVETIRDIDISPGWFSDGPWGAKLITVSMQALSLDDIEHRILRPIWQDPRLHYAVNCASLGCPDLFREAFDADRLDEQLDRAASNFINHPRAVHLEGGDLVVSSIYHWFSEDFGASQQEVIRHIRTYAAPALKNSLAAYERWNRHQYDWRLNDSSPQP
ncbi:DUF547 domain-containing protein [Aestuariispira insulae]|uniref:Uncharacterized protein DUF547 n=1 Tax=Aestuariispira insulae TaxID=1461337 RepID=A0A3D9HWD6_9PROT|nr:DUF547 domain-containing protein [Aestuariispira insulae]RED53812.1 uncharacterized protein DUF547 [Aestuariispira insulae]